MITAFDILVICAAILIMLAGFAGRRMLWRAGRQERRPGDLGGVLGYLIGQQPILKRRYAGIAHLFLFWGIAVFLLVIILAQFPLTIPAAAARILSLGLDILGAVMLAGTVFFLIRRSRSKRISADKILPRSEWFPAIILLIILITGFVAAGTRMRIVPSDLPWTSPIGWGLSNILPDSPLLMQIMIRSHFFAVLLFLACLPFTFMRHLAAASLNVYYRRKGNRGQLGFLDLDGGHVGARTVEDLTWKQLLDAEACVSCGRCVENCPATISGKPLSPRKIVQDLLRQMEQDRRKASLLEDAISADEIWSCTTCMACVEHCPIYVEPLDKILEIRRHQVMGCGNLPSEAKPMIRDLEIFGDVQGQGIARRTDWALNRKVPVLSDSSAAAETLLWIGCSGAFHPRYREASIAMVNILNAGAVDFAILGKQELCCGDPARRLGDERLFQELARKNIERLNHYQVQKIVTLCPHCFNTLKNEYPGFGGRFQVLHATEFVLELINKKRIAPTYPVNETLAVHDPCYLGRVNQIFEPLRDVCREVSGIEIKELPRNRENGFCCGGGGGRMWLHESLGRHINHIRAEEAAETGVELVGTACPYCLTMLEDGIGALEMDKPPRVKDIIEIVAASLGK
jgi:Fe-S oxidoreductase/nitrate reductase gamma subunit